MSDLQTVRTAEKRLTYIETTILSQNIPLESRNFGLRAGALGSALSNLKSELPEEKPTNVEDLLRGNVMPAEDLRVIDINAVKKEFHSVTAKEHHPNKGLWLGLVGYGNTPKEVLKNAELEGLDIPVSGIAGGDWTTVCMKGKVRFYNKTRGQTTTDWNRALEWAGDGEEVYVLMNYEAEKNGKKYHYWVFKVYDGVTLDERRKQLIEKKVKGWLYLGDWKVWNITAVRKSDRRLVIIQIRVNGYGDLQYRVVEDGHWLGPWEGWISVPTDENGLSKFVKRINAAYIGSLGEEVIAVEYYSEGKKRGREVQGIKIAAKLFSTGYYNWIGKEMKLLNPNTVNGNAEVWGAVLLKEEEKKPKRAEVQIVAPEYVRETDRFDVSIENLKEGDKVEVYLQTQGEAKWVEQTPKDGKISISSNAHVNGVIKIRLRRHKNVVAEKIVSVIRGEQKLDDYTWQKWGTVEGKFVIHLGEEKKIPDKVEVILVRGGGGELEYWTGKGWKKISTRGTKTTPDQVYFTGIEKQGPLAGGAVFPDDAKKISATQDSKGNVSIDTKQFGATFERGYTYYVIGYTGTDLGQHEVWENGKIVNKQVHADQYAIAVITPTLVEVEKGIPMSVIEPSSIVGGFEGTAEGNVYGVVARKINDGYEVYGRDGSVAYYKDGEFYKDKQFTHILGRDEIGRFLIQGNDILVQGRNKVYVKGWQMPPGEYTVLILDHEKKAAAESKVTVFPLTQFRPVPPRLAEGVNWSTAPPSVTPWTTEGNIFVPNIARAVIMGLLSTADIKNKGTRQYLLDVSRDAILKGFDVTLTVPGAAGMTLGQYFDRLGNKNWEQLGEEDKRILSSLIASRVSEQLYPYVGKFYNALKDVYFAARDKNYELYQKALKNLLDVMNEVRDTPLYSQQIYNLFRTIYDSLSVVTTSTMTNEYIYRINKDVFKRMTVEGNKTISIDVVAYLDLVTREWVAGRLGVIKDPNSGNLILAPTIEALKVNHWRLGVKSLWAQSTEKSSLNLRVNVGIDWMKGGNVIETNGHLFWEAQAGYVTKLNPRLFLSVNAGFRSDVLEEVRYDERRKGFVVGAGKEEQFWATSELVWVINPRTEIRAGIDYSTVKQGIGTTRYFGEHVQVRYQISRNITLLGEISGGTYKTLLGRYRGTSTGFGIRYARRGFRLDWLTTWMSTGPSSYSRSMFGITFTSPEEVIVK